MEFLQSRADEAARQRALEVKDITGTEDPTYTGCFMELHEWIIVPQTVTVEELEASKLRARLDPGETEEAKEARLLREGPSVTYVATTGTGEVKTVIPGEGTEEIGQSEAA